MTMEGAGGMRRGAYAPQTEDDGLGTGGGSGGAGGRGGGVTEVFAPEFTEDVHAAAAFRGADGAAVSVFGPSEDRAFGGGVERPAGCAGAEAGAGPQHALPCGAEAPKKKGFDGVNRQIVRTAKRRGLIGERATVAGDSTGFESRHTSRYYAFRRGFGPYQTRRYPKLSAVCDCATHLVLSAKATVGPSYDCRDGPSILRSASRLLRPAVVLLDAAYDSEPMHELIRRELGAESVIPATRGRPTAKPLTGPNRQRMREQFPEDVYGQRWQVESLFSRIKRRFGSALSAKLDRSRAAQIYARLLAHNLALLLRLLVKPCNRAVLIWRAASSWRARIDVAKQLRADAGRRRLITRSSACARV